MRKVNMSLSTALLFTLIIVTYGANLPNSFKKCNRKQPDLKKCLLEASQNGISQLGHHVFGDLNLVNINPLIKVPKLDVGATGAVAVEQHFENCKIFGLHSVKLEVFDWDLDENTLRIKGVFPEIKKMCHYRLNGRVLLLPIKGEGPSTVILYDVTFEAQFSLEERKRKNKTYVKIVSNKFDFETGLVYFNFENLFDGDKELGDNINRVLNDNWKEVFDDVKGSYSLVTLKIIVAIINHFFSKFSVEELLD